MTFTSFIPAVLPQSCHCTGGSPSLCRSHRNELAIGVVPALRQENIWIWGGEKERGEKRLESSPVAQILAILVNMAHHDNSAALDGCGWGMGWWPGAGLACWLQSEEFLLDLGLRKDTSHLSYSLHRQKQHTRHNLQFTPGLSYQLGTATSTWQQNFCPEGNWSFVGLGRCGSTIWIRESQSFLSLPWRWV